MVDTSDGDHVSEQHSYHDEEGEPMCFMGTNSEKRMADQRHLEGRRTIRRSMLQLRQKRVTEAVTAGVRGDKAKAKANRRAKEGTPRVSMGTKAATTTTTAGTREEARSRTCAIHNLLLPQLVYQSAHEGDRLMTTSWNG